MQGVTSFLSSKFQRRCRSSGGHYKTERSQNISPLTPAGEGLAIDLPHGVPGRQAGMHGVNRLNHLIYDTLLREELDRCLCACIESHSHKYSRIHTSQSHHSLHSRLSYYYMLISMLWARLTEDAPIEARP